MMLHTSHGNVIIEEQRFLLNKRTFRPLSSRCSLRSKQYTLRLQRFLTDFGADVPFHQISQKMLEHHGFSVNTEATRIITNKHAAIVQRESLKSRADAQDHEYLIAEADGVMVPTVAFKENPESTDKRKDRTCEWKEMRVAITYPKGSRSMLYSATMTSPNDLGDQLLECVKQLGFNEKTKVHFVGDGALWIAEQSDRIFGAQSTFLIDFYHLSSYLSAAGQCIAPEASQAWFENSKKLAKESKIEEVLQDLNAHISSNEHAQCAALTAYNYIMRRPKQFDYKNAKDENLPIGSGKSESTNKSLVQTRLKRAGAWWLPENALAIINLRILRIRGLWSDYWQQRQAEYRF